MPTKSEITSCLADGALAMLAGSAILGLPLLVMLLGPGWGSPSSTRLSPRQRLPPHRER